MWLFKIKEYEYNISIKERGDLWYYTIAQEIDGSVELLCWGFTESLQDAAKMVGLQLKGTFSGY